MEEIKKTKIEIPAGCEVDKTEVVNGALVVTFKERKLPKSWEEFCEMYPDYSGEYYIYPEADKKICKVLDTGGEKRTNKNAELLPDQATAEAVLALCQLIQLRNCYNGDWVPDWNNRNDDKWIICFHHNKSDIDIRYHISPILYFKTRELRDMFFGFFRDLIEKLKPLYGISL